MHPAVPLPPLQDWFVDGWQCDNWRRCRNVLHSGLSKKNLTRLRAACRPGRMRQGRVFLRLAGVPEGVPASSFRQFLSMRHSLRVSCGIYRFLTACGALFTISLRVIS